MIRDELTQSGFEDLAYALDEIERQTNKWWSNSQMWWFTDHTAEHSRRVARYCEKLAHAKVLPAGMELNVIERFLLAAAAWVHDIGMQSPHVVDSPAKANAVRRAHPERSRQLIDDRTFQTGLNDPILADAIGRLAHSHGTEFYRVVVDDMDAEQTIRDHRVRLPLLSALLLLADELDLHNERAIAPIGDVNLPPLSAAHWLKHQFVSAVAFELLADGDVEIVIETAKPRNMNSLLAASLQQWIVVKLQIQIGMVEREIRQGFRGDFRISRRVRVVQRSIGSTNDLITPEVIAVVENENAVAALINHKEVLATVQKTVNVGGAIQILGPFGPNSRDAHGREDLLEAILRRSTVDGHEVVRHWRLDSTSRPTAADILCSWAQEAGIAIRPGFENETELTQRTELLGALVSKLNDGPSHFVLSASSVDELGKGDLKFLIRTVCPQLMVLPNVSIVLSASSAFATEQNWEGIPIGPVSAAARGIYLSRYMDGKDAELVAQNTEEYSAVKRYAIREIVS